MKLIMVIDPLTVRFVANSITTTLEVKNALRKCGYDAHQASVSPWLFVISLWKQWYIHDTGT